MSPEAQIAWREQLLRRKVSRLAGVPMTVLRRQRMHGGASAFTNGIASGVYDGYHVVVAAPASASAPPSFCTKLTARAVIEGRCPVVTLNASSSPAASSGKVEVLLATGGATGRGGADEKEEVKEAKERHGGVSMTVDVKTSVEDALVRRSASPLTAKIPVRGFHLVDLHGVVRNCVEWRHCLPKVEPCFRVGDNRDEIVLGVAHALGVRLSCSSVNDVKAAVVAARCVSTGSALSPKLLDTHVCRPPALLRTSSAAGVQVYEVDSADELRRVWASRRRGDSSETASSRESKNAMSCCNPDGGPADVLIRLATPLRQARQVPDCSPTAPTDGGSTAPACSRPLEGAYGATAEAVVEIVKAAAATSAWLDGPIPIVGFSVDVGPACWDDSHAVAEEVYSPPCAGSYPPLDDSAAPGEAVASVTLLADIDAAIAAAFEMARCAAAAATTATADTAIATSLARATIVEDANSKTKGKRGNISRTTRPRAPFVFQRLHVTGLGEGGARGEPLTALKSVLCRYLPKAGSNNGSAASVGGAGGKPFTVSADATAHLVAGGVWSTVASIIGRKDVAPVADSSIVRAAKAGGGSSTGIVSDSGEVNVSSSGSVSGSGSVGGSGGGSGGSDISRGDGVAIDADTRGAMYYIDDGCYGSLSGALLRGVQMQPSPLSPAFPSEPDHEEKDAANSTTSTDAGSPGAGAAVPREYPLCTVWGPTCDGLDCVSRVTPLPDNMKPGRDWLFFPDTGTRAGADATDFNGLKPLGLFYCLRQ